MLSQTRACPLCYAQRIEQHGRVGLLQCQGCGLVLDNNVWDAAAALRLEAEWFEERPAAATSAWVRLFEAWNNRRTWRRLVPQLRPGTRLLEIGVGSGSFLAYMRARGVDAMGCDLSQAICDDIQARLGISVFRGTLQELDAGCRYDVIVMNHVLEHVNDPLALLADVRSRLVVGGILHVAVPNVACWEAALAGWNSYEPYHLLYFTPHTVRRTVEQAGFEVLWLETHESFSGWFLALLRTALRGRMRDASARKSMRQARSRNFVEHVYQSAKLISGLVTLPLRRLQAAFGHGDEVIVLARPAGGGA